MAPEASAPIETGHTTSSDGTTIGWHRLGTGPAVVVVHGALATGEQFLPVAHALADEYTLFLVDRRGRPLSGDAEEHDLATEIADVQAVLAVAGPGATLFGHSYGGIVSAATAAAGADISALVLYEPPLPVGGPLPESALAAIAAAVGIGDNDRALTIFLSGILHASDATVADLRQTPTWAEWAALAPVWLRELRVITALVGDLDRFTAIRNRTLLLLGADSPQHQIDATGFLAEHVPGATLVEFPGQEHFAHVAEPVAVADAIRSFLRQV
jgi:pimeloyl-ACP methyl ester carboxylesterase